MISDFESQQQPVTDEITLAYRELGTDPPVLLLHGLADHSLVWYPLAAALSDRYRCLAPDLRGHGDSSQPAADQYDASLLATDLELFCQRQGLGAVHVVAHSWAAKIALVWARQQPDRLQSLVLVDPFFVNRLPGAFRPTFPLLYRTLPFLKVMGPFATLADAAKVAQGLKQYRGWNDHQQAVFQAGMTPQSDGQWRSKFAIAARNGVFSDVVQTAGLTQTLPTPTALLLPEGGLNRMAWQTRPYHQYLTHLTVQTIPGNHWPHLVEPEACNAAVANFLAQIDNG